MAVHLSRRNLKKGFKKCCMSSAVDVTGDDDNDMLWNVTGECEEDEGTDCEDGDSNTGKGRQNLMCFVH